jgi:hypothetical protein
MLKALLLAIAAAQAPEVLPLPPTPDELQHELNVAEKHKRDLADAEFQIAFYPDRDTFDAAIRTAENRLHTIGQQISCLTEGYPGVAELMAEARELRDMEAALWPMRNLKAFFGPQEDSYHIGPEVALEMLADYRAACVRHGKDPHGLLLPPTWPVSK